MRKLIVLSLLLVTTGAYAQSAPPPRLFLDVGGVIAAPQGDMDDEADTSLGVRLAFGGHLSQNFGLYGFFRYAFVNLPSAAPTDFSERYYDFGIGGHYIAGIAPQWALFVGGELFDATLRFSNGGTSDSHSNIGLGVRGGAVYQAGQQVGIRFAAEYSTASIDNFDAAWLTLDVSAVIGFQ